MSRLDIVGVSKSFGAAPVLRGVDLTIARGEFLTLLGPSGCGKTTLLRIIAGLVTPDSGDVLADGASMLRTPAEDRQLAMVFQNYALYPHLTVGENIALPLQMRRMTRLQRATARLRLSPRLKAVQRQIDDEVRAMAASLDLAAQVKRYPAELSGGQRQRVALGRALVRRPRLLLMDEPLSSLDAQLRVQLRSELTALHRATGATFIFVTHDQAEAMTMSDRIAVVLEGAIAQVASPAELYDNPCSLGVARFIGTPRINTIPVRIGPDGWLRIGGHSLGQLDATSGGRALTAAVRPEHVALGRAHGHFAGCVVEVEHLGYERLVHVETALARIIVRMTADQGPAPRNGDEVGLRIDDSRLLLFDGDGRRIQATPLSRPAPSYA